MEAQEKKLERGGGRGRVRDMVKMKDKEQGDKDTKAAEDLQ